MKRLPVLVAIAVASASALGVLSAVFDWSDTVTYAFGGALVALLVSVGLPRAIGSPVVAPSHGARIIVPVGAAVHARGVKIIIAGDAVRSISTGTDAESSFSLVYSPEYDEDSEDVGTRPMPELNRPAGSVVGVWPMQVTMLLADAAEAIGGKLYILGGGWSITGPDPSPSAIALYIRVPWDRAIRAHDFRLELVGAEGEPVRGRNGEPIAVFGTCQVGQPAALEPGTPLDVPLAINVSPLSLDATARYE